jgi:hypothetical protein
MDRIDYEYISRLIRYASRMHISVALLVAIQIDRETESDNAFSVY